MRKLLTLILFAGAALAADRQHFDKITTASGKTYEQVDISKVTELEIRFTHAGGIAAVPMGELPPELQKFFGFDPVAADFAMINTQAERRQALIAEEQKKAANAALLLQQKGEHEAIKAIEAKGIKLSLSVIQTTNDTATCVAMRFKLVEVDGRRINGKKVQAKKKMNGEYELAEQLARMPGTDPSEDALVVIHGLEKPLIGQQIVRVVYPCAYDKKGVATDYATTADMAYGLSKQKLASR